MAHTVVPVLGDRGRIRTLRLGMLVHTFHPSMQKRPVDLCEPKASLVYITSSRLVEAT